MMTEGFTLVYILGAGHCGSTLLNLLLNGHSQMVGLSEISSIGRYVSSTGETGEHPFHTAFWRAVEKCYESTSGQSFDEIDISNPSWKTVRSWDRKDITSYAWINRDLLSCIAEKSGASLLVDASKHWQRLYVLQQSGLFPIKVIHLIRDGRGVINSYIRKYDNFGAALRRWAAPALCAFYLRRKFKASDWLQTRYEDLAMRPKATLQRICVFLQVNFESDMLAYRQHPDVGIGGNRMRIRQDERILLDERWRQEFSCLDRIKFAFLGGWLNKIYGY
jgi:hypothetical protein